MSAHTVRTIPFQRPSWLSTVLFALAGFLFSSSVAGCFIATWLPEVRGDEHFWSRHDRPSALVLSLAVAGGLLGGPIAGWAWRSPSARRFHIVFSCGFVLLAATLAYTWHVIRVCSLVATEGYDVNSASLATPLVAVYAGALAILLLASASYLDHT